ncbi:MAG: ABC transporter ATP-binding protein/permease [Candidatus Methanoplasma sp.]|jgi:ATP-binding cassette subfamily B protein|nr:ABC transporter ATP-binding protein/permease [Candidatus Methanoplasma sp.]
MNSHNKNEKHRKTGLAAVLEISNKKKGWLILSGALATISEILAIVPFVIIYLIAGNLLNPPVDRANVEHLLYLMAVMFVLRFVFLYASGMISHVSAYNILYTMRTKLAERLGKLPMGYFSSRTTGSLKKMLGEDVERIELFIAHYIPDMVSVTIAPAVVLIYLATTDWMLALASALPIPIAFLLWMSSFAGDKDAIEDKLKGYHRTQEEMNGTIVEYIHGMPVVKAFNQSVYSFDRFKRSVDEYKEYCIQWTKAFKGTWAGFTTALSASLLFILPVGLWKFSEGTLGIDTFILFLIVGAGVVRPIYKAATIFSTTKLISGGVERINSVLNEKEIADPPDSAVPEDNSVEFDGVTFSYDKTEVLRDVTFRAEGGSVTALVGPSGAGKSTIAQLIPRLWDTDAGSIKIGGTDVRNIPYKDLMNMIAFVFQDAFVFSDTVEENILMGNKSKTRDDAIAAAKAAQIHETIESLPMGYDTVLGDGGHNLSGGEKQRISIARAILKDAPIIILDEATAFSDPDNESRIQEAIGGLVTGKTVIVVAHRLSTIKDADQILVVDRGQIAEKGTHEDLVAAGGIYRRMWESHTSAQEWTIGA